MQILPKKALWLAALFALTCGAASAQSPAGQVSHTVQPGETLYRISRQYGVTVEQIVRLNPGLQGTAVKSGQTLLIPIVPTAADSTATEESLVERIALRAAIRALPGQEQKTILLRFYKGLTQQQCARILGVSQVQVSRLEKRALEKLRREMG